MNSTYRIALDGIPAAGHGAEICERDVGMDRNLSPWWSLGCIQYTAGIRRAELRLRNSLPTFRNRGACLGDAIALDLSPSPFAYAVRFA